MTDKQEFVAVPDTSIKRGMHVMLYSHTSRLAPGGTQAVYDRLARRLRDQGHRVTEGWSGPGPVAQRNEWICPLEVDASSAGLPKLWSAALGFGSIVRLAAGLAARRPDIVNVHFLTGHTLYFLLLSRLMGFKIVLSAHGSDILRPTEECRKYLPWFVRSADAVTVVSKELAEYVRSYPGVDASKVHVIANGIDHSFWATGRNPASTPTVVSAGRFEQVKGFDTLLLAFGKVREKVPARLILAGEGTLRDELIRLVHRLGLADCVEFPGYLNREDTRELFRAATVFALPSRSEGMPLALLEAMAVGVPAVAARVGGVPEVMTEETGLLVLPDDPDELASALLRILTDPVLAANMGLAAQQRAQAFDSSFSDQAYEDLFQIVRRP